MKAIGRFLHALRLSWWWVSADHRTSLALLKSGKKKSVEARLDFWGRKWMIDGSVVDASEIEAMADKIDFGYSH